MVFGGAQLERIALSESTAWSGASEPSGVNPDARGHLSQIRELLFDGRYEQARDLCERSLLGKAKNFGTNLPLPELQLTFAHAGEVQDYRRSLDLDEAVARVRFRTGNAILQREVFVSHADGVLAVRLTGSRSHALSFSLAFARAAMPFSVTSAAAGRMLLEGNAFETLHSSGQDGVHFAIRAQVLQEGGKVLHEASELLVSGATSVTILVAIATSFGGRDPLAVTLETLARAAQRSFSQLRAAHIEDHRALFRRVVFKLDSDTSLSAIPTDERRRRLESGGGDPELAALFFQFGRYLTIAGSRADSPLPLALQGIWNDGLASSMGWTDDFHLDINTEQNYWAAEVCNLGECQWPLLRWIGTLRTSGQQTAREMYGVPGWVAHTVSNPWGYSAPGWGIGWGLFVTAGIWISLQLWEHYTFNPDREFLRVWAYPVLRDAAAFFMAYMVAEPSHKWLVTGPSDSPENWYTTPSGARAAEAMGNTCDRVLVHALLSMCIEASETLDVDEELRHQWMQARERLPPFQVGSHGQLQEWLHDFAEAEPNHRHTSHLISLYPLQQVSPRATPQLARAAEVTIERRTQAPNWEQSEWGYANLVAYSARLLQGDRAERALNRLITNAASDSLMTFSRAGVAGAEQNIFAVDGNTAASAAIAEMLLQSQAGEIVLLPALPLVWPGGTVRGLCARGGWEVDIAWRDGKLVSATLLAKQSARTSVRYRDAVVEISMRAGERRRLSTGDFSRSITSTGGTVDRRNI
jgi:alpha-L-fucosidase 2